MLIQFASNSELVCANPRSWNYTTDSYLTFFHERIIFPPSAPIFRSFSETASILAEVGIQIGTSLCQPTFLPLHSRKSFICECFFMEEVFSLLLLQVFEVLQKLHPYWGLSWHPILDFFVPTHVPTIELQKITYIENFLLKEVFFLLRLPVFEVFQKLHPFFLSGL